MSYLNAPATRLLATQCAVCSRPLVDSVSVETGIGPLCREKHGYNVEVAPEARAEANRLVHFIAAQQSGPEVLQAADALRGLGFAVLSARILDRLCSIAVTTTPDGLLSVQTPFNPDALPSFRELRCRPFDKENKANLIAPAKRALLWKVLQQFFPGALGRSEKGVFIIPERSQEAA